MHEYGHTLAAITFGIPIVRVDIEGKTPALLRGHDSAMTNDERKAIEQARATLNTLTPAMLTGKGNVSGAG